MRHLSLWAKEHPIKARTIIITSHVFLGLLAYFIGNELRDLHISFSSTFFSYISLLFIMTAFVYPHKKDKPAAFNIRYTYWFRKCCDMLAVTCSFCLLCSLANNVQLTPLYEAHAASHSVVPTKVEKPTAQEILSSLEHGDKKSLTRSEKRILKKEFKKQLKVYAIAKIKSDEKTAGQALLIMLAIIAAVGLLYLVAALACSLSCSGSDAAAVLVGVVGGVAIVWLLIYVIKKISHPKNKDKTEPKEGQ